MYRPFRSSIFECEDMHGSYDALMFTLIISSTTLLGSIDPGPYSHPPLHPPVSSMAGEFPREPCLITVGCIDVHIYVCIQVYI